MPSTTYLITPGSAGHWAVFDPKGRELFAEREFRTPLQAFTALQGWAEANGMSAEITSGQGTSNQQVQLKKRLRFPESERSVTLTLTISPELDTLLDNMSEELGVPKGEAILKAFGLLKIALEARREGKGIGILDDELDVEQEITI